MKLYLKRAKGESARDRRVLISLLSSSEGKSNKKRQPSFDLDSRADWASLINISISRQ